MKTLMKGLIVIGSVIAFLGVARYGFSEEQSPKPAPQVQAQDQQHPMVEPHRSMMGPKMGMAAPHGTKPHKLSCLANLQFDEKQKTELKKIYESHRAEINNLWSELDNKSEALQNAVKSGDEQTIRKAFQDVSKVRENMLILRLSMLKEIKNLLSDSQKTQFDSCIQKRFDKFHRRWEGELMRFLNE
ncbi:MAG: Spy/CpxP family protein refolding chaperone [Thermodesulforhabdaceae bacterium]